MTKNPVRNICFVVVTALTFTAVSSGEIGKAQISGKTYYVDQGTGSDYNSGTTQTSAFKTINKANQIVAAGDTVYVKNGTYQENITVKKSGTPDQWISLQAYPGQTPKVRGTQDGSISVEGSYVKVIGFDVTSSGEGSAINVGRGNHHVHIIRNIVHDSGCGGISAQETDYLTIEENISYRNAFRSGYMCSGISIYQAKAFDDAPGFHNIIRGNISYANENKVTLSWGGRSFVTDGNGIIIDDFRQTQSQRPRPRYTPWTLIENNIVFNNGGRGIHVYESDNVVVRNNTAFKNLRSGNLDGHLNGELTTYFSSNVHFHNNIAYSSSPNKKTFVDDYSSNNRWDNNLSYIGSTLVNDGHSDVKLGANNRINVNPLFINASTDPKLANFRLNLGSPAIDSGTTQSAASVDFDKNARPFGVGPDMGAFELRR
ncbi:choice-of-anchor Q domain-containing protein [Anabaena sp. CCY 9910]|uniref:choice-of-anchor Q domain-containing protein n=1 Tax=Anabaena sp. CCY 9910 TaxID=3103870 RepID=UPI0039E0E406